MVRRDDADKRVPASRRSSPAGASPASIAMTGNVHPEAERQG
jgi:hypothetical protein